MAVIEPSAVHDIRLSHGRRPDEGDDGQQDEFGTVVLGEERPSDEEEHGAVRKRPKQVEVAIVSEQAGQSWLGW